MALTTGSFSILGWASLFSSVSFGQKSLIATLLITVNQGLRAMPLDILWRHLEYQFLENLESTLLSTQSFYR